MAAPILLILISLIDMRQLIIRNKFSRGPTGLLVRSPHGLRRLLVCLCYRLSKPLRASRCPQGLWYSIALKPVENRCLCGYRDSRRRSPQGLWRSLVHLYYWTPKPLRASRCPQGHRRSTGFSAQYYLNTIECRCRCGHRDARKGIGIQ